jgi:hypothetical protein
MAKFRFTVQMWSSFHFTLMNVVFIIKESQSNTWLKSKSSKQKIKRNGEKMGGQFSMQGWWWRWKFLGKELAKRWMKDQLNINFAQRVLWTNYESIKVGRKTLTILLKDWIFYVNFVCWIFSKVAFTSSKLTVT